MAEITGYVKPNAPDVLEIACVFDAEKIISLTTMNGHNAVKSAF